MEVEPELKEARLGDGGRAGSATLAFARMLVLVVVKVATVRASTPDSRSFSFWRVFGGSSSFLEMLRLRGDDIVRRRVL